MGKDAVSAKPFQMVGGHPALDFVNTFDDRFTAEPAELLTDYGELLRFVRQAEVITERQFRELKKLNASEAKKRAVLAEAVALREALAAVLYAQFRGAEVHKGQLSKLEKFFKGAAGRRRMVFEEQNRAGRVPELRWTFDGVGRESESVVWLLAQAANDLLTSTQAEQIRSCASSTCQWLFLDTSKNHTRRWCDMKICGNRNKARRFQKRQANNGMSEAKASGD